ncbi:MAG: sugar transferase [Planctomycetales bacterium]
MSTQPAYRPLRTATGSLELQTDTSLHPPQHANGTRPHPEMDSETAAFRPVSPARPWYLPLKVVLDGVLAGLLLVVLGPVILFFAALVRLSGPAFYRQVRVGLHGRRFQIIKLRTMIINAEAKTGAVWCSGTNDPRITRLGQFLRKTHIDEFPQLINVLRGEMSLIGPRPERPEIIAKLDWEISYYHERLKVRPGISGLAQLRLPPDSDLESVRRKVVHDLYYVRNISPWLDFRLLTLTAWSLLKEVARPGWRLVELPDEPTIRDGFHAVVNVPAPNLAETMTASVGATLCDDVLTRVPQSDEDELVECQDLGE